MKAIFAPIDRQAWRRLRVMVPVAIMAVSGPLPATAQPSQLQHAPDAAEQMAAHETSPRTEEQHSLGGDGQKRSHARQTKCDRNETVVDGRCVAKHADKPRRQAQRARERDEAPARRARVESERPAKGSRLCWTQDGKNFSVSPCN